MAGLGCAGSFAVRETDRAAGSFSLTLHIGTCVKHFKIAVTTTTTTAAAAEGEPQQQPQQQVQVQIGKRTFGSFEELVAFYSATPLYTNANGESQMLVQPLVVPSPPPQ